MFTPKLGEDSHFDEYLSNGVETTNVVIVLRSFLSASSTETGASQFPKSLSERTIVIPRDVKSSLVRESLSG